jgi:ssDNA-binding Zn-finger/Zn-ribbon topoisomerase 1
MMDDVREVPCPSCSKALYELGAADFGASIFGKADKVPKFISQSQGIFLKCPHCAMFVLMHRVPARGKGLGFEIHPSRKYFEKLPEEG